MDKSNREFRRNLSIIPILRMKFTSLKFQRIRKISNSSTQFSPNIRIFSHTQSLIQRFQGYENFINNSSNMIPPNFSMPTPKYWQHSPIQHFGQSSPQMLSTPRATGMSSRTSNDKDPTTPTSVLETQLSQPSTPIDLEILNGEVNMSSKWTIEENEHLANSFVMISDDLIVKNYQKASAFWKRVTNSQQ